MAPWWRRRVSAVAHPWQGRDARCLVRGTGARPDGDRRRRVGLPLADGPVGAAIRRVNLDSAFRAINPQGLCNLAKLQLQHRQCLLDRNNPFLQNLILMMIHIEFV